MAAASEPGGGSIRTACRPPLALRSRVTIPSSESACKRLIGLHPKLTSAIRANCLARLRSFFRLLVPMAGVIFSGRIHRKERSIIPPKAHPLRSE